VHEALSHIEKTLSESYRKEIDQEENIWRSLPFFATTVSLQLAAIAQFVAKLPPENSAFWLVAVALLSLTGGAMLFALAFLIACIFPATFNYISKDQDLLQYTLLLLAAEQAESTVGPGGRLAFDAGDALKRMLANEYALTTDHNRRINERREFQRVIAGLAVLTSTICTVLFVALIVIFHYTDSHW
jgi:hypothetical protein